MKNTKIVYHEPDPQTNLSGEHMPKKDGAIVIIHGKRGGKSFESFKEMLDKVMIK